MAGIASVLNAEGIRFVEMVDDLSLERVETHYRFTDEESFRQLLSRDLGEGMRVYWTEILQRAHLAAVTAVLRSRQWFSGVEHAIDQENFLMFAAGLRGLMESAADASTALVGTPLNLAHWHSMIVEALKGQAASVSICSELEDELIHYSHGRRITRAGRPDAPKTHQARQVQDYLSIFRDQNAENVRRCYRDLCDITPPGASSVWMWLHAADGSGREFRLSAQGNEALIIGFLHRYPTIPLELLMFAFNAPAITLSVLNYFPIADLHTPELLTWHLDGIPAWTKCRDRLEGQGIVPVASAPRAG